MEIFEPPSKSRECYDVCIVYPVCAACVSVGDPQCKQVKKRIAALQSKGLGTHNEANNCKNAVAKYVEALIWCSGSSDFAPGGKAHVGWEKLCAPLLKQQPQ